MTKYVVLKERWFQWGPNAFGKISSNNLKEAFLISHTGMYETTFTVYTAESLSIYNKFVFKNTASDWKHMEENFSTDDLSHALWLKRKTYEYASRFKSSTDTIAVTSKQTMELRYTTTYALGTDRTPHTSTFIVRVLSFPDELKIHLVKYRMMRAAGS